MAADTSAPELKTEYLLDNAWQHQRERLSLLEGIVDPGTVRHLDRIGVAEGWRCLEVGGGGGSIAGWLCRRVGPSGSVLATDIDTRFLDALDHSNLQVCRHDIRTDDLPRRSFDLVHLRAVLCHLPDPEIALGKLVAALKPGGFLLAEDSDYATWQPLPGTPAERAALFRAHWRTVERRFIERGMNLSYGPLLPDHVRAQGIQVIDVDPEAFIARGTEPLAEFFRLTFLQVRDLCVASGELSAQEIDRALAMYADPEFTWSGPSMWRVSGRVERLG